MKKIMINGELVDLEMGKISLYSPSVRYGLIIFEAMRVTYNENDNVYNVFRLQNHLERFFYSCKMLGFNIKYNSLDIKEMIMRVILKNDLKQTMGVRIFAYYDEEDSFMSEEEINLAVFLMDIKNIKDFKECKLLISDYNKSINGMLPYGIKSSAHYVYSRVCVKKAKVCGFDDVIYLNDLGYVTESSRSSLFVIKDETVYFPKISDGVLSSITRDTIIKICEYYKIPCKQQSLTREDLYKADELYLAGTSYGLVRVSNIDGYNVEKSEKSLGNKLSQIYSQLLTGNLTINKEWLLKIFMDRE